MSFWLRDAPARFPRAMDVILAIVKRQYGRHVIALGKQTTDMKSAQGIKALWCLSTATKLCFFTGIRSVYQRFATNVARMVTPINRKLMKEKPLQFFLDKWRETAVGV